MFGRSKKSENDKQAESAGATAAHPARPGAKNRPTPTRREAEAARRKPLVDTDRKSAKAADRDARRAQAAATREAMMTGDEKNLPPRDKGPERRYIRDYVDARWNIGEFMLPLMLIVLALSFIRQTWALTLVFIGVYGLLFIAIADAVLMWRRLKKQLIAKFGDEPQGGAMYAIMRAFQMRRGRMPRPQVARGQYPS
ncbi:MAG: DUF3043 domain-containing protein [Micrococcales bacterium]|nr:DUF3043 domain-containing protein [Micrococcales bacterium]